MMDSLTQEDFSRYCAYMFRSQGTIQAAPSAPVQIMDVQVITDEYDEWVATVQFAPKDKNVNQMYQFDYKIEYKNDNWVSEIPLMNNPAVNFLAI